MSVKPTKLVHLSIRNLLRNRRRTLITMVIICAGFAAMGLVVGYMQNVFLGLTKMTIRSSFTGAGGTGHFQILRQESLDRPENRPLEFGIDHPERMRELLKDLPRIEYMMPRIDFGGLLSNGERSIPFLGLGVIPHNEALLRFEMKLTRIDNTPLYELEKDVNNVILGSQMALMLQAKTGDTLQMLAPTVDGGINTTTLRVAGSISTGSKTADKYFLMVNMSAAQRALRTTRASRLVVVLGEADTRYTDQVAQQALEVLHQSEPNVAYAAPKWYELAEYYDSIRTVYAVVFTFMSSVIFVIVMLSCNNTLLMATMERIREIGTLRAIGISMKWIQRMFYLEGILLGIMSSVVGFIIQQVVTFLINAAEIQMPPPPGTDIVYRLLIEPLPGALPWIFVIVVSSTALSSLVTFRQVKRLTIVDALSHT